MQISLHANSNHSWAFHGIDFMGFFPWKFQAIHTVSMAFEPGESFTFHGFEVFIRYETCEKAMLLNMNCA